MRPTITGGHYDRDPVPGDSPLRIALLTYRGNPFSGGQGVYVRHLSAALTALGHDVTVFSGQPYPDLGEGVRFVPLPSLDLYRDNAFRTPRLSEFRDWIDAVEFGMFCTAGFPEPLTFSLRARRALLAQRHRFDIVHDNQGLGWGMLGLQRAGVPLVASIHHAVVIDRDLELAREHSRARRVALRRWYGFHKMQATVAQRMPRVITVSEQSREDIVQRMGVRASRIRVIPLAVDDSVFSPQNGAARVSGRIITVASADVPLKGVVPLLHAVAALRRRRHVELLLIGYARRGGMVERTVQALGLREHVRFVRGIDDAALAREYAAAEVAVVPSLYEGFSMPALQAMACGLPLVATRAGALPEVVGGDGDAGLLVAPGDADELAAAIGRVLDDHALRTQLSAAAVRRAQERFSWAATARATVDVYREMLRGRLVPSPGVTPK